MYSGKKSETGQPRRGSPGSDSESMRLQPSLPSIRHLGFPPGVTVSSTDSNSASNRVSIANDSRVGHDFPMTSSEEANPQAGSSEPPKKKRRRQALSCTECKRRKIKCDRAHPCGPCARRGEPGKCQWHVFEPVYVHPADSHRHLAKSSPTGPAHPVAPSTFTAPSNPSNAPVIDSAMAPPPTTTFTSDSAYVSRAEYDDLRSKVEYLETLVQHLLHASHLRVEELPQWSRRPPSSPRHHPILSPRAEDTGRPGTYSSQTTVPLSPSRISSHRLTTPDIGPVNNQIARSQDRDTFTGVSSTNVTSDGHLTMPPPSRYPPYGNQLLNPDPSSARSVKRPRTASMSSITYSGTPSAVPQSRFSSSAGLTLPTPPGSVPLPSPSEMLREPAVVPSQARSSNVRLVSRPGSPSMFPHLGSLSHSSSRSRNVSPGSTRRSPPHETIASRIMEPTPAERHGWTSFENASTSTSNKPLTGPDRGPMRSSDASLPSVHARISPEPRLPRHPSDSTAYDRSIASADSVAGVSRSEQAGGKDTASHRNLKQEGRLMTDS